MVIFLIVVVLFVLPAIILYAIIRHRKSVAEAIEESNRKSRQAAALENASRLQAEQADWRYKHVYKPETVGASASPREIVYAPANLPVDSEADTGELISDVATIAALEIVESALESDNSSYEANNDTSSYDNSSDTTSSDTSFDSSGGDFGGGGAGGDWN